MMIFRLFTRIFKSKKKIRRYFSASILSLKFAETIGPRRLELVGGLGPDERFGMHIGDHDVLPDGGLRAWRRANGRLRLSRTLETRLDTASNASGLTPRIRWCGIPCRTCER